MQQGRKTSVHKIWFRRWTGKNYAVFASLGKHICISVLAVSYSLISLQSFSQQKKSQGSNISTDTLPEVEITPDDESLLAFPTQAIQCITPAAGFSSLNKSELAEQLPGVDIRQRGNQGVQGDIQYRGGSPEQCMILLNGVPMNDAQTGHHNLNLPIPDICIAKVSVYSAGESILNVPGAYTGIIRYTSVSPTTEKIAVHLAGGSFKFRKAEALYSFSAGKTQHLISYSSEQSAGYQFNTDFSVEKLFYHFGWNTKSNTIIQVQAGAMNKNFGAQGFYSNRFPTQFESIKTGFTAISMHTNGKVAMHPLIYWKRNHDRFELFRESLYKQNGSYYIWDGDTAQYAPGIYYSGHNYHLSDRFGAVFHLEGETPVGTWKTGLSYSYDNIFSSVLGETMSKPRKDRCEDSIYFDKSAHEQQSYAFAGFAFKNLHGFRINLLGNVLFHRNKLIPGGGLNISYSQTHQFSAWISANRSYRIPTFTELYYRSATNLGNSELRAETAFNSELGFALRKNGFELQNRFFIISGKNTIDWVRQPDEMIYTAMNHISLLSVGNTIASIYTPEKNSELSHFISSAIISYTWLHKEKYDRGLISAYSLDYLQHKITASLSIPFSKHTGTSISFSYLNRTGSYTYDGEELAYQACTNTDVSLYYRKKRMSITLAVQNITATQQVDFGGIVLPGRWFTAGIQVNTSGQGN